MNDPVPPTAQPYTIGFAQFPGSGSSRKETNAWVVRTVRAMDKDPRIKKVESLTYENTPIPMLRNLSVLEARQASCDYLLMVDSDLSPDLPYADMEPFWDVAWAFMMNRRAEEEPWMDANLQVARHPLPPATIAAPYCGPPPDECCYVFQWTTKETDSPNPNFRLEMVPRELAAIKSGIQIQAALPTGLILYDMRVFDILPPTWFEYEYGDPPFNSRKVTTEDVYQTRNASMLGLPQYCAWSSWAGHMKTKRVGRPSIVTRDQVHFSLREAVLRGYDTGDRFVTLPELPKVSAPVKGPGPPPEMLHANLTESCPAPPSEELGEAIEQRSLAEASERDKRARFLTLDEYKTLRTTNAEAPG